MKKPRILTFNWHEGYIHLLAKTGFEFDVVQMWKGGRYGWIKEFRPVPDNCRLITEEEGLYNLRVGKYDAVVCHNTRDFSKVSESDVRKILVHHNNFLMETGISDENKKIELVKKLREIYDGTKNLTLVFISEMKKKDWGLDGEIVLPGIDLEEYGGYTGEIERVLRVGNGLKERDIMLGYSVQERILDGIPSTVLGLNPSIEAAIMPKSWDEYREYLRTYRVYLNTTLHPHEDGYNLAMLEAMATGMPVVSISNPSTPLTNGENGFVSDDELYLKEMTIELLNDPIKARRIGQMARETVRQMFPIERFIKRWRELLEGSSPVMPSMYVPEGGDDRVRPLRVLMSYTANPQTTGYYFERALRRRHQVITYGPSIADPLWEKDIIKEWKLESIRDRVKPHDIPYLTNDITEICRQLKELKGWSPEIFFYVDSGIWYHIEGLDELDCPKVCYLIDVHLDLQKRLEWAKAFDYVFIAQKQYIEDFKRAGIEKVFWIPLGCDPEIHGKRNLKKIYDIGFVGSLNNRKRIELINVLSERFDFHYERCFLERMAEVYSQSKIVFNISVNNDLNMRVFEALCSGSMLLTDEARGSGLTEIFKDRRHLVVYRDREELIELADYYLRHHQERERIAEAGMKEALKKHTYGHRVDKILSIVKSELEHKKLTSFYKKKRPKPDNAPKDYYRQERRDVIQLIPDGVKRVLDVGCAEGILGKELLKRGAEEVVGVEIVPEVCRRAEKNLTSVICGDIEQIELPFKKDYFDCIVLADVLEHLREPLDTLKKLRRYLSNDGLIVSSIPNVRYIEVINMLVEGYWRYAEQGVLDRTHLRFFTLKEMKRLFSEAGYEITYIATNLDPRYDKVRNLGDTLSFGRVTIRGLSPEELKDLFVFQYILQARKTKALDGIFELDRGSIPDKEIKLLEEHLRAHPADVEALLRYAELCYEMNHYDKAVESIENILLFYPDHKEARELAKRIREETNVS